MQTINLDMTSGGIPPVAHCSQCDFKKPIKLVLHDGSLEYTIPDGATVMVLGRKHDNHPFEYDSVNQPEVVTYSGSEVTIYTTVQMTAAAGDATCEIRVTDSASQIYSANFILDVEAMAVPQDNDISDMDMPLIIAAIKGGQTVTGIEEKITEAGTILSNMENETAESSANAKAAKTSEENAKTSETNAKASETASKASEDAAAASATAAKNSQTQAAGSATKAANQATAAATSAHNAATSESNAKASETAAKASETAAKASETAAAASESNAAKSETAAKESEDKANGYAGAAETSETHARESETNAKASETAAAESEANAKTYMEATEEAKSYCVEAGDKAKTWAIGQTGTRDGEDTDNAKYYSEQAKKFADTAEQTDVADLTKLIEAVQKAEATVESNLTAVNHDVNTYPAFVADRLANVTDLNDCTTNGIYQFTATASNSPVSGLGMVLVLNSTGSGETGYIAQYAWLGNDAHTVYARDDHSGTWGEWKQVGADGDVINGIISRLDALTETVGEKLDKSSVDSALSADSTNPVQNKVVKEALEPLNTRLTSSENSISTLVGNFGKNISQDTYPALVTGRYQITDDLDNALYNGLYTWNKASNTPNDATYGVLMTLNPNISVTYGNSWIMQIAFPLAGKTAHMYTRSNINMEGWSEWEAVLHS